MSITISGNGIVEANLADNAVTLAKMASGTDGEILTYDASGNPTAVSVGTDGQVLTSTGAGSPPAFEAAAGGVAGISTSSTSGTAISIDSNNIVTYPNRPCFNVLLGTTMNNIATSTDITVQYNSEHFDLGADFNTSTYTFTAPVTGKYQFTYNVNCNMLTNTGTNYFTTIKTSNRDYNYSSSIDPSMFASNLNDIYTFNGSIVADLDSNDTAYITFHLNGGGTSVDIGWSSYFSGFLVA